MVRYPRKQNPETPLTQELPKQTARPVPQEINLSIEPIVKGNNQNQFKIDHLIDQIRSLEEKLKSIENVIGHASQENSKCSNPKTDAHEPSAFLEKCARWGNFCLKYFWIFFFIVLVYGGAMIYNKISNPPYIAVVILKIESSLDKIPSLQAHIKNEDYLKIIKSSSFKTAVISKAWGWGGVLQRQSWFMYPVTLFYENRIAVGIQEDPQLITFKARAFQMDKARQLAGSIQDVFVEAYKQECVTRLNSAIELLDGSIDRNTKKLGVLFTTLAQFKPGETYIPVSAVVKKNLDAVLSVQKLELEEAKTVLNNELKQINQGLGLRSWSVAQEVLFRMYQDRLVDMEFKKLLISKEYLSSYEGGMRPVKTSLVKLINDYAKKNSVPQEMTNNFIRGVFLGSRLQALDVLLNQHYGISEGFTGRMADFGKTKSEMMRVATALENLLSTKGAIANALLKRLEADIVVDTPVVVLKK